MIMEARVCVDCSGFGVKGVAKLALDGAIEDKGEVRDCPCCMGYGYHVLGTYKSEEEYWQSPHHSTISRETAGYSHCTSSGGTLENDDKTTNYGYSYSCGTSSGRTLEDEDETTNYGHSYGCGTSSERLDEDETHHCGHTYSSYGSCSYEDNKHECLSMKYQPQSHSETSYLVDIDEYVSKELETPGEEVLNIFRAGLKALSEGAREISVEGYDFHKFGTTHITVKCGTETVCNCQVWSNLSESPAIDKILHEFFERKTCPSELSNKA